MELIGRGLRLRAKKNPRMRYVRRARQPSRRPAAGPLAALGTAQQDGERGAAAARTFPGVPGRSAYTHTVSRVSLRCAARCLRHRAGRVPRATLAYLAARPLRNSNSRGSGTGFGDGRRQVSWPGAAHRESRLLQSAAFLVLRCHHCGGWRREEGGREFAQFAFRRALFHAHRHDTSCTRDAFLHPRHC